MQFALVERAYRWYRRRPVIGTMAAGLALLLAAVPVLLGFFLVAMGVIARRTFGIGQARALRQLELDRDAANAVRVRLEGEIRDASSRARRP